MCGEDDLINIYRINLKLIACVRSPQVAPVSALGATPTVPNTPLFRLSAKGWPLRVFGVEMGDVWRMGHPWAHVSTTSGPFLGRTTVLTWLPTPRDTVVISKWGIPSYLSAPYNRCKGM